MHITKLLILLPKLIIHYQNIKLQYTDDSRVQREIICLIVFKKIRKTSWLLICIILPKIIDPHTDADVSTFKRFIGLFTSQLFVCIVLNVFSWEAGVLGY